MRMGDSLDESCITAPAPAKRDRVGPVGARLDWIQQPSNSGKQVCGGGAQVVPISHEQGCLRIGGTSILRGGERATSRACHSLLLCVYVCYRPEPLS